MEKQYRVHFLGIGGISQSAIALILKSQGHFVTGSDCTKSLQTKKLEEVGISVSIGCVSPFIKDADVVVQSASIHDDDKELAFAKKLGKRVISRAEALGFLSKKYEKVISISGSHGKTTTTGMIAKIFCDANKNPTIHIGGNLPFLNGNVRVGGKEFFITEACEYVNSFLELESDISVILNVQKDHLDFFKNFKNIKKSFNQFAKNTKTNGLVVFNFDDPNDRMIFEQKNISFSQEGKGIVSAKNIKEYDPGKFEFDCHFLGVNLGKIRLGVFGKHNISNALASICVALQEGIEFSSIQKSLFEFEGARRRFERFGDLFGTVLVHDYAHHPTEIRATISLAKEVVSGDVFVIFQPHTFSRTKLLLKEFKTCFHGAKEILVFKTYSARENPKEGIDQTALARELVLSGEKASAFDDYLSMLKHVFPSLKKGDMLLVLGAGDIESFLPFVKEKYERITSKKI